MSEEKIPEVNVTPDVEETPKIVEEVVVLPILINEHHKLKKEKSNE